MKRYHRCTVPRRLWSFALPWPGILAILSLAAAQLQGSAVVRDVTSAGAAANDAQDDAAAIQKVIDVSIAGETVFLPAGTFLVNRTLRARSGLKIQGAGREQTIIKLNAVTQTDFFDGAHTYSHPGTYRVTLIVWDNHGRGAIKERSVLVR